jgi:hypothetical protein
MYRCSLFLFVTKLFFYIPSPKEPSPTISNKFIDRLAELSMAVRLLRNKTPGAATSRHFVLGHFPYRVSAIPVETDMRH